MRKCKNLNKSSEPKCTINYINKGNMGILIGEKREKKGELRKNYFLMPEIIPNLMSNESTNLKISTNPSRIKSKSPSH